MSDLVGHPEDRFSHNKAQITAGVDLIYESTDCFELSVQIFRNITVIKINIERKFCQFELLQFKFCMISYFSVWSPVSK